MTHQAPEMAGIGALLRPNKYNILKFVDLHPGGSAKLSGEIREDDRLVSVNGVLVKDMTAEAVWWRFHSTMISCTLLADQDINRLDHLFVGLLDRKSNWKY